MKKDRLKPRRKSADGLLSLRDIKKGVSGGENLRLIFTIINPSFNQLRKRILTNVCVLVTYTNLNFVFQRGSPWREPWG